MRKPKGWFQNSKSKPAPLSEILPQIVQGLRSESRPTLEAAEKAWSRTAGKAAALHSWPKHLTKGRLLVEVENSGWMYTLSLKKQELLKGLIRSLGGGRVKELQFRIGEREDAQNQNPTAA